jgi:hypothetical protein
VDRSRFLCSKSISLSTAKEEPNFRRTTH